MRVYYPVFCLILCTLSAVFMILTWLSISTEPLWFTLVVAPWGILLLGVGLYRYFRGWPEQDREELEIWEQAFKAAPKHMWASMQPFLTKPSIVFVLSILGGLVVVTRGWKFLNNQGILDMPGPLMQTLLGLAIAAFAISMAARTAAANDAKKKKYPYGKL